MIQEFYISRSLSVDTHKLCIARRSLVLAVAGKHALYAHADALGALDGAPSLISQEVEAYDSVRVDVRMHGDWAAWVLDKGDLWRLYGVRIKEDEFQPIDIILIQRVVVQDTNVKEPFLQVVAIHELYTGGETKLIYLLALLGHSLRSHSCSHIVFAAPGFPVEKCN